jgi:hypothetical protein
MDFTFERKVRSFWSKVEKTWGCWIWHGAHDSCGYGHFTMDGKKIGAHRMAWFLTNGEMPSQEIDHTCRNRTCVNVAHMRDVSHKENIHNSSVVKAICVRGHPLADPNLYRYTSNGVQKRRCLACHRLEAEKAKAKRLAAKANQS